MVTGFVARYDSCPVTEATNAGLRAKIDGWSAVGPDAQVRCLGYVHKALFGGYVGAERLQELLAAAGSVGLAARTLLSVASRASVPSDPVAAALGVVSKVRARDREEVRRQILLELASLRAQLDETRALEPVYPEKVRGLLADLNARIGDAEGRLAAA